MRWQRRQAARGGPQLLPVSLIGNRSFLIGMAMVGLLFSGIPGFFLVLALYLQNGYGLTPLQSGLTTLPFSVGVLSVSLLASRFGMLWPRRRITAGALMLAAAMVWVRFAVIGTGAHVAWSHFAPALLLGGLGLGVTIGPLFQTVLACVPRTRFRLRLRARCNRSSRSAAPSAWRSWARSSSPALPAGLPAGGDPHAVYAAAFSGAVLYNAAAFVAVALLIRALPKPRSRRRPRPRPWKLTDRHRQMQLAAVCAISRVPAAVDGGA